jgi:hypothetical protein
MTTLIPHEDVRTVALVALRLRRLPLGSPIIALLGVRVFRTAHGHYGVNGRLYFDATSAARAIADARS